MKRKASVLLLVLFVGIAWLPIVRIKASDEDCNPFFYGVGTCFEINDSPYQNITLFSTEAVSILLRTGPGILSFAIESNGSATSTTLTLRGLKYDQTYSRYQDGYFIDTFTIDAAGECEFTQELLEAHHITIQEGQSTIYILSDGTVSPNTAPISIDGSTYTFTSNIYEPIIVQISNVVLDGNGYMLQGSGSGRGVYLDRLSGVTIKNIVAKGWWETISVYSSSSIEIINNDISSSPDLGILLYGSDSNKVINNVVKANRYGIGLVSGSNFNLITDNSILDQSYAGVYPYLGCGANSFYHNNFINNRYQVRNPAGDVNLWDNGYPSGGNYWSNYLGVDLYSGPNQDEAGPDGIGDTPYTVVANNIDHYPLKNSWTPVKTSINVAGSEYGVTIVSNSLIDRITATKSTLHFEASGLAGQAYIKTIFPMVNKTTIRIFVDGSKLSPPPFPVIWSNGTHYFIYFEFSLSTHSITIQFAPVDIALDLAPESLNLKSQGEWITSYIELPEDYDVNEIDISTISLNSTVPADTYPLNIGDCDNDGVLDLMVKFNRTEVISFILANVDMSTLKEKWSMTITLTVTGELYGGTLFQGGDAVKIIRPGAGLGRQTLLR